MLADLRKKDRSELDTLLKEAREKARELRFKLASRQLKDVRALRKTKKEVARLLSIINEQSQERE